ncbi:MAG TPA: hypothetical protein PLR50_13555 [Candidatus Rifleibacterium sp.]|jgi:hypothetical protein|nr:hypothetical protein [Candidatus Rifleibacterium sp.]HQB84521.1 hypothetical protein [Candidatus Rifleibacterium sp.]
MVVVSAGSKVCGAEDLHLIGIPELADNIVSLMSKNGPTGEIKVLILNETSRSFLREF